MNWRKLVLNYAADVLHQIGEDELAHKLRFVDVPLMDGGGVYFGHPCGCGAQHLDGGIWQTVKPDETRRVFLWLQ